MKNKEEKPTFNEPIPTKYLKVTSSLLASNSIVDALICLSAYSYYETYGGIKNILGSIAYGLCGLSSIYLASEYRQFIDNDREISDLRQTYEELRTNTIAYTLLATGTALHTITDIPFDTLNWGPSTLAQLALLGVFSAGCAIYANRDNSKAKELKLCMNNHDKYKR